MAERISAVDPAVDELRRKARRRLVGAIVLALAAAVILPMLLEKEPRPLGEDVQVKIPPVDEGKFVNRLSPGAPKGQTSAPAMPPAPAANTPAATASAPSPAPPTAASAPAPTPPSSAPAEPSPTGANASSATSAASSSLASSDKPAAPATGASAGLSPSAPEKPETKAPASPTQVAKAEPASPLKVEAKSEAKGATREAAEPGAAVKGKASEGGYVVQLAAFSDDKGANALAAKLKRSGYPAYTETVKTSRGTLYRVRVGGYPSREAAGEARNKLKGDGYAGIVAAAH